MKTNDFVRPRGIAANLNEWPSCIVVSWRRLLIIGERDTMIVDMKFITKVLDSEMKIT